MNLRLLLVCFFGFVSVAGFSAWGDDTEPVRIAGSSAISKAVSLAVPILRERGIRMKLLSEGGSGSAISSVGDGSADIAISGRPIAGPERAAFPEKRFYEMVFGIQALTFIVPKDVWESGVHALNRDQIRRIYEREITNWKDLGGEDRPIKFYNPEQGHGVWEFFVTWVYGEQRKAPLGENFETVGESEETRNIVEFNAGSISVTPAGVADNKQVFALSIRDDKGEAIEPTPRNIREKRYPVQRPLFIVTGERPTGRIKDIIEFMLGKEAEPLIIRSELTPVTGQ